MKQQLSVPVFTVSQPIGTFFVGTIRARELLLICKYDYRRMQFTNGYVDFLGIQRPLNHRRTAEIARYANTVDACFPTSIVISIDEKCTEISDTEIAGVRILRVSSYKNDEDDSLSIPFDQVASIIDGQHRLKGLEESGNLDFELNVSIFIGADDATEATIFSIVNLAQTKVNKSLVYDLFSLAKTRSPEKTCHEIVVALDRLDESPFQGLIKRLGVSTDGRIGETLSQATVVKGILPYISNDPSGDRDRGKRFAFWEPLNDKDAQRRVFYPFYAEKDDVKILQLMINYFSAISHRWSGAWDNTGKGSIIKRTNGYNGFMRFFRPAYLYFTTKPRVVSEDEFAGLFKTIDLHDDDFNPRKYLPGSSGATALYNDLLTKSRLDRI